MPANIPNIEQDIQRLVLALDHLTKQSVLSADTLKILTDALNRLQSTGIRGFANIRGSFDQFVATLKLVGQEAGFTKRQIDELMRSFTRVQETGRLGFGFAQTKAIRPGQRMTDVTLGLGDEVGIGELITKQRQYYSETLPGGARAIANVEQELEKMGLSLHEVSDVTEDSARGVVRWTASMQRQDGITQRAVVTTNRWGQVLRSTQRHLRTFTSAIIRDIVEVTKWAIAVAVVYAPLRRLTQLMQEAVQVEAKLADVQVALGGTSTALSRVWEEAAQVARELGVSAEGVVDGYVLAARATANIRNPTERAAATVSVLKDSMLLAKLAGIDQAIAMDTLVGALRQLGRPLTEGAELLDKWVAVSRSANVSLHTLAEAFAITSTAAENVGLDLDHLNGVIAAVAEVTTLSATESGNAVRAFISGFQTDQAERELARFGISVRNIQGELRAFTEVIEDIIERRDVGLISDRELAKIAEVIGGGARRGAQVNAFLENYARVQELAAISANASGDAADALAIKMDTLQSSLQNLNNAFTELAKALGTEGGFLDLAQRGVEGFTGLVDILTGLTRVLGKATPAVLAFAAAWLVLRRNMMFQGLMETNVAGMLLGNLGGRFALPRGRLVAGLTGRGLISPQTTLGGLAGQIYGAGGGALGGGLIGAGMAFLGGNLTRGNLDKAGAQIGGAAVGALLAGGSPIGALIGGTIVEAFFTNIIDREVDLRGLFVSIFSDAFSEGAEEGGEEATRQLEGVQEELIRAISPWGVSALGRTRLWVSQQALGGGEQDWERALLVLGEVAAGRAGEGPDVDLINWFFGFGQLTDEQRRKIGSLVDQIKETAREEAEEAAPTRLASAFGLRLLGISEEFGPIAEQILQQQRSRLLQQVAAGETGVRALTEFLNIGAFEQVVSTVYGAMTSLAEGGVEYGDVAETLINATEQEREVFVQLAGEIANLENQYAELALQTERYGDVRRRVAVAEELAMRRQQLAEMLEVAAAGQRARAFEAPTRIELATGVTEEQIRQLIQQVRSAQERVVEAATLDPAEQEKIRSAWGDVFFQIGEDYRDFSQIFTDINEEILNQMIQDLGIGAQAALGIITPDIASAQAAQLRGNIAFFERLIAQLRPLEREDIGVIFNDYVTDILHADNLAVQLALRTLIEVNEQQLEGIFNIPEGITAQIPFTGRLYFSTEPIPTAGAGGLLEALGPPLEELPGEIESQTDTLHSDALQQIELLNQMLASGAWAPEFMDRIEAFIRELGGEPVERGEPVEPVRWADIVGGAVEEAVERRFTLSEERGTPALFQALEQIFAPAIQPLIAPWQDILGALPQSIPVTINTRIVNPISVFIDSLQVQRALEERHYEDLQSATRRSGAIGYIME